MTIWLELMVCLAVMIVAGYQLCRFGDAIADKAGLSRSWVGLVLIATATSLPELATGISSVTAADVPDIAVGDILGSCVFNLLILVVLDFFYRRESVFTRARHGHVISAGFGTALIGFVGLNLMIYQHGIGPRFGHVGLYAPVLLLMYVLIMRTLFRYEREQLSAYVEQEVTHPDLSLRQAVTGYLVSAAAVVGAGTWLPFVGESLAGTMGWKQSFVGTLLVASITSAPEVVTTLAALRLGAVDMAIGNLLGSNLFNVALLALDDILYLPGPLLASVSASHAASAFSAMMMGGLAITGLMLRPESRVLRTVSWISLLLLSVYLLNSLFLYLYAG